MRVAAIDIGTNSVRLLVAEVETTAAGAGELLTLARAGEPCRLGRGLHESGRISEEMAERAAQVAGDFARRARGLGARHIVLGATAALRSAANGAEVAERIAAKCAVPLRILTGNDEAQLVYRAVIAGLGNRARRSPCVVFDLGGGSTEIISGVGLSAGRWISLPFGAVTLTERYLRSDPVDNEEVEALTAMVEQNLMQHCASLPSATPLLAGVGGTVTLLAMLDRGLESYEPTALEGWLIPTDRLKQLVNRLRGMRHAERIALPAMGEGRADIVVAGAIVVEILSRRFPSSGLVCSTQGLRYGLARLAAEEAESAATANPTGGSNPTPLA
ncbi:MAG: Ppx/GppA phosphatase family protein [Candidatus Eisenbacteria bacterium]